MDLLLVNVPRDFDKKPYDRAFPFARTMNFGILAIAGYLLDHGFDAAIHDLESPASLNPAEDLLGRIAASRPTAVGLSCISGYSYPSTLRVARQIREALPETVLIVGGKDHVGVLGSTVLAECPSLDAVVTGEGEEPCRLLLTALRAGAAWDAVPNLIWRTQAGSIRINKYDDSSAMLPDRLPRLRHELYPEFTGVSPSVEVSRGCPFGCRFCVSARSKVRKKSPADLVREAVETERLYGAGSPTFYLQTPMFLMTDAEIMEVIHQRDLHGTSFSWRTETRVDYLSPAKIRLLARAGMRVVDVGLESGSPEILRRMGKTSHPDRYIRAIRDLVRAARDHGVLAKLNVLFYVGERPDTIVETLDALSEAGAEAVSAYPLLLYPGTDLCDEIDEQLRCFGGSLVHDDAWRRRHLTPVNPSKWFSYEALQEIGVRVGRAFQLENTFRLLKRFGYFPPSAKAEQFHAAVAAFGVDRLPYARSPSQMFACRRALRTEMLAMGAGEQEMTYDNFGAKSSRGVRLAVLG